MRLTNFLKEDGVSGALSIKEPQTGMHKPLGFFKE